MLVGVTTFAVTLLGGINFENIVKMNLLRLLLWQQNLDMLDRQLSERINEREGEIMVNDVIAGESDVDESQKVYTVL